MPKTRWKLDQYLLEHSLNAADVEREIVRLGFKWGERTIYRFTGEGPANINRGSLTALIAALRSLTKRKVRVNDLLEFEE